MAHTLSVSPIFCHIISFLDTQTNRRASWVCRKWSADCNERAALPRILNVCLNDPCESVCDKCKLRHKPRFSCDAAERNSEFIAFIIASIHVIKADHGERERYVCAHVNTLSERKTQMCMRALCPEFTTDEVRDKLGSCARLSPLGLRIDFSPANVHLCIDYIAGQAQLETLQLNYDEHTALEWTMPIALQLSALVRLQSLTLPYFHLDYVPYLPATLTALEIKYVDCNTESTWFTTLLLHTRSLRHLDVGCSMESTDLLIGMSDVHGPFHLTLHEKLTHTIPITSTMPVIEHPLDVTFTGNETWYHDVSVLAPHVQRLTIDIDLTWRRLGIPLP